MTKLHELLAVVGDLAKTNEKIVNEAANTFGSKPEHFIKTVRVTRMYAEKDKELEGTETKAMVETVASKLEYVASHASKFLDVTFQKENANARSVADVEVDGVVLVKDAPGLFLLRLDAQLVQWRLMVERIPTLQPGRVWVKDEAEGKDIWKTDEPIERQTTRKALQFKEISPATDKHPAQVKDWMWDEPVGKIAETQWSSMMSPAQKSDVLGRIDRLIRATKRAAQRANATEVVKTKVSQPIFDFILGK